MTDEPDRLNSALEWLDRRRKPLAYVLFIISLFLAGEMTWLAWKQPRWDFIPFAIWCGLTAFTLAGAGIWQLAGYSGTLTRLEATRIFVLTVGGLSGLYTWLLSLALLFWSPRNDAPNDWWNAVTGGLSAWQGLEWWRLWVLLLIHFTGLAVMFVSLLLGRAEERSNVILRRLIYGYNALLSAQLLAAILIVLNILVYIYVPAVSDWTASGLYTLSGETKNILGGLKKPVKVYVMWDGPPDLLYNEVETLLKNCQEAGDQLQVIYLSRDRNEEDVIKLMERYQLLDVVGLLVVHGEPPHEDHQFIRKEDLFSQLSRRFGDEGGYAFKGEDALMTAINFLTEGKTRKAVYFTQGSGELDIFDAEASRFDRGAGDLRERLVKSNYEVKGLILDPLAGPDPQKPGIAVVAQVPPDAEAVVVAGPRQPFKPEALQALREYMKTPVGGKKGKLIVLFDVVAGPDGKMLKTGLEPLLAEYRVNVGDDRVLTLSTQLRQTSPEQVAVLGNPNLRARNPVAASFQTIIPLFDLRTVRPERPDQPSPEGNPYQAEALFLAVDRVWADSDLRASPAVLAQNMRKLPLDELKTRLSPMLPVAVAVTETLPLDTSDPQAFRKPREQKPRLVVFGDASFVCNRVLASDGSGLYFALFSSNLNWLRERPESIGIKPKERDRYTIAVNTNVERLIWLPPLLMLTGIAGLGAGVWMVRRR